MCWLPIRYIRIKGRRIGEVLQDSAYPRASDVLLEWNAVAFASVVTAIPASSIHESQNKDFQRTRLAPGPRPAL